MASIYLFLQIMLHRKEVVSFQCLQTYTSHLCCFFIIYLDIIIISRCFNVQLCILSPNMVDIDLC